METYNYNDFKEQELTRYSYEIISLHPKKGVLRGLHFQKQFPQDKLFRVIKAKYMMLLLI